MAMSAAMAAPPIRASTVAAAAAFVRVFMGQVLVWLGAIPVSPGSADEFAAGNSRLRGKSDLFLADAM